MDMKQAELREELKARQGKQSDYEFARTLGVPVTSWRHYRTGRRGIGLRLATAAEAAYPRLRALIWEALKERKAGDCEAA